MKIRLLFSLLFAAVSVTTASIMTTTNTQPVAVHAEETSVKNESEEIKLKQIILTFNDEEVRCSIFIDGAQYNKEELRDLSKYPDNTVITINYNAKQYQNNNGYYWEITDLPAGFPSGVGIYEKRSNYAKISGTLADYNKSTLKQGEVLSINCICVGPTFTVWTRIERLIDSNVGTILIAIITALLLIFSKVIIRTYNMGRNSRAELVSKKDFDDYKVEQANVMAVNKADTQNTLVLLTKQMIKSELGSATQVLKSAENINEYQTELKVRIKGMDALTETTATNTRDIRNLERRLNQMEFPDDSTKRRSDRG